MQKSKPWLMQRLSGLGQRLLKSATSRVMAMTVAGMFLSLLVDILIAARLGTTFATDTLIIALSIPRMIETVGREGTRFSLLTLFVEVYEKQTETDFFTFFSGLLNLFLILGVIIVLVGVLLAPYIVVLIGPGLSLEYKQEAILLFRLAISLVIFAFGATVLEAILNSQDHFIVASSRNAVLSGTVVLAIIIGWNRSNISVWVVSAYSIGYILFFIWLFWYGKRRAGIDYYLFSWPSKSYLARIWRPILYPTTSIGIRQLSRIAERAIASTIAPGGVAIYYFAFRLISAAQSIIGISVTTTGLPNISRLALNGKQDLFLKAIYRQVKHVVIIGLPVTLFVILFHKPLVNLLYGRGNVDKSSVEQIGLILQILGSALLFWSIIPVFSSTLFALHKYVWVFYNVIIIVFVNLILAWILAQLIGLPGIALATTIAIMLSVLNLYLMLLIAIRKSKKRVI